MFCGNRVPGNNDLRCRVFATGTMFDTLASFTGSLRRQGTPEESSEAAAPDATRRRFPRLKLPRRRSVQSAVTPLPVAPPIHGAGLRVLSWNLLRRVGATCEDVARLIEAQNIDVALLQEATVDMEALPSLIGGAFVRHALPGRIHGPAIWARNGMARPRRLPLESRAIRRHALIADIGGTSFACVHLSHGQLLCRRQARAASEALVLPSAVVAGDFNMVGPLRLAGFREVGPREPTHYANGIVPVRIDRCFVRGLVGRHARALDRGRSDHRPIVLDLFAQPTEAGPRQRAAA